MKRRPLCLLLMLTVPALAGAQVTAPLIFSADCDAATSRDRGVFCFETGDSSLWVCDPEGADPSCEAAGDWVQASGEGGGSGTVEGPDGLATYHPDRIPDTCDLCDEWNDGADDLSWTNANFGSSSVSYERDKQCILSDGTDVFQARWVAAPANTTWVATAKIHWPGDNVFGYDAGLVALIGGTPAAPTRIERALIGSLTSGSTAVWFNFERWADYDTLSTNIGSNITKSQRTAGLPVCIQLRYNDSSSGLTFYFAEDCQNWKPHGSTVTLPNDPTHVGIHVQNDVSAHPVCFDWFRLIEGGTVEPGQ